MPFNSFSQLGSTPYAQRVAGGFGVDGGGEGGGAGGGYSNNPYSNAQNIAESGISGGGSAVSRMAPPVVGGPGGGGVSGGGDVGLTDMFSGGGGGGSDGEQGGLGGDAAGVGEQDGLDPTGEFTAGYGNISEIGQNQSVDAYGNVTSQTFQPNWDFEIADLLNPMGALVDAFTSGSMVSQYAGNAPGLDDYSDATSSFGTQTGTNSGTFGADQQQADNPTTGGTEPQSFSEWSSGMSFSDAAERREARERFNSKDRIHSGGGGGKSGGDGDQVGSGGGSLSDHEGDSTATGGGMNDGSDV